MKYKLLYLNISLNNDYDDQDEYSDFVVIDSRHEHLRQEIINKMTEKIMAFINRQDVDLDNITINDTVRKMSDNCINCNIVSTNIIKSITLQTDELWLSGLILETDIPFLKWNCSDGYEKFKNSIVETSKYEHISQHFHNKKYIYGLVYWFEADYDNRGDFGRFAPRAVSYNLKELIKCGDRDFEEMATQHLQYLGFVGDSSNEIYTTKTKFIPDYDKNEKEIVSLIRECDANGGVHIRFAQNDDEGIWCGVYITRFPVLGNPLDTKIVGEE